MTFALVKATNGTYSATLIGAPEVTACGSSREEALEALRDELLQRVDRGELVPLDLPPRGITALAGIFADDPSLPEIVEEAYRQRDLDRDRQFGPETESTE